MNSTTITFDCGVGAAYDHDATVTELDDGYARVTCDCGHWSFVGPVDDVEYDDMEHLERYDGVLSAWEAHVQLAANLQWCRHHDDDDSHWIGSGDTDCGAGEVMAAGSWRLCAHDDDGTGTHRMYAGESCEAVTAAADGDDDGRDELESWVGGLRGGSDGDDAPYARPAAASADVMSLESRMLAVQELHRPAQAPDGWVCAHCSGTSNQSRVAWPCDTARLLGGVGGVGGGGRAFPGASV